MRAFIATNAEPRHRMPSEKSARWRPRTHSRCVLGKTHVAFGALFWAGGAPVVAPIAGMEATPAAIIAGFGIAAVASVLPDIDHPNALITKGYIPGSGALGPLAKLLGLFISVPPRIVGMLARSVMGHRGGTHSILFMALWTLGALPIYALFAAGLVLAASGVLSWTPLGFETQVVWDWGRENVPSAMPLVMSAVFLGYLSHLFSDSLNQAPVPWLWPAKRRFFFLPKPLRIQVGGSTEWLIRMLVVLLAGIVSVFTVLVPGIEQARGMIETAAAASGLG